MEYVPCIGNSSYSFWRILLKLYRCFKDGLKICILFSQNPEIIFYHFLRIFNLDIFRALILLICIWSIYLVSATPPTVFGESFWNFTGTLQLSFDFTWEICHLLDITAVAGHLAWLAVLFFLLLFSFLIVILNYCKVDYKAFIIINNKLIYLSRMKSCLWGWSCY